MKRTVKIGTRESELAVWQAKSVQILLQAQGVPAEIVYVKSEGDLDLVTPLYEIGVQGIFTKALDSALLNHSIDLAVHSYKDVPIQLPLGISKSAVLERASYKDILVHKGETRFLEDPGSAAMIATSSIRRKAQWLHRFPNHSIANLRGNVNTRLRKLAESDWQGAIFAAAGLERIGLRPSHSIDLDWMLPAPAQGAIITVCREEDKELLEICKAFHDPETDLCTGAERDFLKTLMGGCATPISALASIRHARVLFKGNILSPDGKVILYVEKESDLENAGGLGKSAAEELLSKAGNRIQAWINTGVDR